MIRVLLRLLLVVAFLLIAGVGYFLWPRQGNLREFDSDAVARLETGMWRDYYARDYQALGRRLYSLYRDEYHFSPADSAQLAFQSAKAAQVFQPTTSRAQAQAALPYLIRYYALLRDRGGEKFDAEKAARLELDWWQLRRENATPVQYGDVVAKVSEELFQTENEHLRNAAKLRAEMMHYRDERRDGKMQAEDWVFIEKKLKEAYRELKIGVARGA